LKLLLLLLVKASAATLDGIVLSFVTMSRVRFRFLLGCQRFDYRSTRTERRSYDKLAPIREIFDKFSDVCESVYSLGENVTIDEKLGKTYTAYAEVCLSLL
jgi:hypothetical protein